MSSEQPVKRRNGCLLFLKIVVGGVALLALGIFAALYYFFNHHDRPSFDHEKARMLSPAKRAEYDRLLFNDLSGSQRDPYTREAEWERMAAEGHELSYWMLFVRSPARSSVDNAKALERMEELAEQGDASAMCGYMAVLYAQPNKADPRYVKGVEYIKRGAELGHPECKRRLGSYYLGVAARNSQTGIPFNKQRGFELLVESVRNGYSGSGAVWVYFDQKGLNDVENIKRAYCWSSVNEQFEPIVPENMTLKVYLLARAKDYASKNKRPDILSLVKQLENTQPTLEQCIALGPN